MKKIITILILSLLYGAVMANDKAIGNIENLEKDLVDNFEYPANDFLNNIDGLFSTSKISIKKSIELGANVQYVDYPLKDFNAIKVDEKALARDVNNLVDVSAKFFKSMPDKKGVVLARMVYLPGFKKPFQINKSANKEFNKVIADYNKEISKNSDCNKEGFCSITYLMSFIYLDMTDYKTVMNYANDFSKFEEKNNLSNQLHKNKVFHQGKNNLKPLSIILILGTNGQVVNPIIASNLLQLAKNGDDLSVDPSRELFVALVNDVHNKIEKKKDK